MSFLFISSLHLFVLKETYFSLTYTSITLVSSFFCADDFSVMILYLIFVFHRTVVPTRFQHGRHRGGGKTKQLLDIVALLFLPVQAHICKKKKTTF